MHLETFETEIEPRLNMERRRAALAFSLLARLWLVLVAAITARGVIFFVPGTWEAAVEMIFFLGAEVVIAMQFFPSLLLAGARGNWVAPLVPVVRVFLLDHLADAGGARTRWFPSCIVSEETEEQIPPPSSSRRSKRSWTPPRKRESSSRTKRV